MLSPDSAISVPNRFEQFLQQCKRMFDDYHISKHPTCFISYAWEKDDAKNKPLQNRLQKLKQYLEILGATVQLDIRDMQSNLTDFMKSGIARSDYILLIGTPRLKERLAEKGTTQNNAQYEFDEITKKWSHQPNCLLPLMLDGDYAESFPSVIFKNLIRDMREIPNESQDPFSMPSYVRTIAGIANPLGLIPVLYGLTTDTNRRMLAGYQLLWEYLEVHLAFWGLRHAQGILPAPIVEPCLKREGMEARLRQQDPGASAADIADFCRYSGNGASHFERAMDALKHQSIAAYCQWYRSRSVVEKHMDALHRVPQNEDALFLRAWSDLAVYVANPDARHRGTADNLCALLEYLPRLNRVLLHTQQFYPLVMKCYHPFVKHPHNGVSERWVEQLVHLAASYVAAANLVQSKWVASEALGFYEQHHMPIPMNVLAVLTQACSLTGHYGEAMLWARYASHVASTPADKSACEYRMRMIQDSALVTLATSFAFCVQTLGSEEQIRQRVLPVARSLEAAGNRLWFGSEEEKDPHMKTHDFEHAQTAYQTVRAWARAFGCDGLLAIEREVDGYLQDMQEGRFARDNDHCLRALRYPLQTSWDVVRAKLRPLREAVSEDAPSLEPGVITNILKDAFETMWALGVSVWGASPLTYAVMAIGSLAREEACPYSDVECALVVQDTVRGPEWPEAKAQRLRNETRSYLKVLMQWLELQLIALGETQKVVVWPCSINTTVEIPMVPGFRLDEGGNIPFSAKDPDGFLVGTADALLTLHARVLANGLPEDMIITNALQGAAYWSGSEACAAHFRTRLMQHIQQAALHQRLSIALLREHLKNPQFNPVMNQTITEWNIKQGFLRLPSLILEALALYYGVNETKTAERIASLQTLGVISDAMAAALAICIALGLTIRNQAHRYYGREEDTVYLQTRANNASDEQYHLSDLDKAFLFTAHRVMVLPTKAVVEAFIADSAGQACVQSEPYRRILLEKNGSSDYRALREQLYVLYQRHDAAAAARYLDFLVAVDPTAHRQFTSSEYCAVHVLETQLATFIADRLEASAERMRIVQSARWLQCALSQADQPMSSVLADALQLCEGITENNLSSRFHEAIYTLLFVPTIMVVRRVFETAFPSVTRWRALATNITDYEAAQQKNHSYVQDLSDWALERASYGEMSTALCCVRFLSMTAYKTDPYYQQYAARFAAFFSTFQEKSTDENKEALMRLPRPDGMRPFMLDRERQWRATLESISDPLPVDDALCVGRLLLQGLELKKRLIKPEFEKFFLDNKDKFDKKSKLNNTGQSDLGTHGVFKINLGESSLHVKFFPEYPGIEKAASRLIHRVVGDYVHESELCKLTWPDGQSWAIMIMRTIPGKNIAEWHQEETASSPLNLEQRLRAISSEIFSRVFIAALLTTNEDAKPDNIMLHNRGSPEHSEYTLTLIDNERCFLPSMALNDKKKIALQMKHFVFCMPQMDDPIDPSVKAEIESLDPFILLNDWLTTLAQDNKRCTSLFEKLAIIQYAQLPERKIFVKGPIAETAQLLWVVLHAHTHESLFWKLQSLKSLWKKHPAITHRQLLRRLESSASDVYDQVAHYQTSAIRWGYIAANYYTVKNGMAVSSLKHRTIMAKTFAIKDKESLIALRKNENPSNACYMPETSQNHLLHAFEVQQRQAECANGNLSAFDALSAVTAKRQVLQSFDFECLREKQGIQEKLLAAMCSLYLKDVQIRSATALTDNLLRAIIQGNAESLTRVTLIDCPALTARGISNVLYYCPGLEHLKLLQLPRLEALRGVNAVGFPITGLLPHLQTLIVKDCKALELVDLELPVTKTCVIQRNGQLNRIFINRASCNALLQSARQKEYDDVTEALKRNPALIYAQGDITESSGQRFEQVSVLEYAAKTADMHLYQTAVAYCPEKIKLKALHPTLGKLYFAPVLVDGYNDADTALPCLVGDNPQYQEKGKPFNRTALIQDLKEALNKNCESDRTRTLERLMLHELKARYYAYRENVWQPEAFFPAALRELFDELPPEKAVSLDFVAYIGEYLDYLADKKSGQPLVWFMLGGFLDAVAELSGKHVCYWREQNGQLCCIHEYAAQHTPNVSASQSIQHILHQTTFFQRLILHTQAHFISVPQSVGVAMSPLMAYEHYALAWRAARLKRKKILPLSSPQYGPGFYPPVPPTAYDKIRATARSLEAQVSSEEIRTLLDAVGNGDLEIVKQSIQRNANLLHVMGDVRDVADRLFSDITVFQYALWAGDIPMCNMILERLPREDAVLQKEALEKDRLDIHVVHGQYFSFEPTLRQYAGCLKKIDEGEYGQYLEQWLKGVGGCQLAWPAWIRYQFTEPGEKVAWTTQQLASGRQQNNIISWNKDLRIHGYQAKVRGKIGKATYWTMDLSKQLLKEPKSYIGERLIIRLVSRVQYRIDIMNLNIIQSNNLEYRETLSAILQHTSRQQPPIPS